ncbi:hypothetical protein AB7Y06_02535 [Providencia rettgeri]
MFQPNILALKGKSNTGKTTTVKLVYKKIVTHVYENLLTDFKGEIKVTNYLSKRATSDIKIMIEIGDFKIGIESQGDPVAKSKGKGRLYESLKLFDEKNCHVIICTTRTQLKTVEYVKYYKDKYEIKWYEKVSEPSELMELGWENAANRMYEKVLDLYLLFIARK